MNTYTFSGKVLPERANVNIMPPLKIEMDEVYNYVKEKWEGAKWPLLLVLIDLDESKKFSMGK
jgi:hypothetical protein